MAVIRLDRIAGTHLESIEAPEDIKNGFFLQLGDLVDDETELRQATKVVDPTKGEIVLHATPEVMADPRQAGLKHFLVEQGDAGRTYHLVVGDRITLTEDLFASLPVVNGYVAPVAGSYLLDAFDATTEQSVLVFRVTRETTLGYDADRAFTLQVTKVQ